VVETCCVDPHIVKQTPWNATHEPMLRPDDADLFVALLLQPRNCGRAYPRSACLIDLQASAPTFGATKVIRTFQLGRHPLLVIRQRQTQRR
jgi:hypothetical protein